MPKRNFDLNPIILLMEMTILKWSILIFQLRISKRFLNLCKDLSQWETQLKEILKIFQQRNDQWRLPRGIEIMKVFQLNNFQDQKTLTNLLLHKLTQTTTQIRTLQTEDLGEIHHSIFTKIQVLPQTQKEEQQIVPLVIDA